MSATRRSTITVETGRNSTWLPGSTGRPLIRSAWRIIGSYSALSAADGPFRCAVAAAGAGHDVAVPLRAPRPEPCFADQHVQEQADERVEEDDAEPRQRRPGRNCRRRMTGIMISTTTQPAI